ncbi:MAG: cation:proton antiporter [Thermoprotei archaeon]|nr:MAG: cation:proton antiporter [Thermoprotei archaeon]
MNLEYTPILHVPALVPILAVGSAFALPLIHLVTKSRKVCEYFVVTITGIELVLTTIVLHLAYTSTKPIIYTFGAWPPPVGIVYEIDRFSALLGVLAAVLFFTAALYSTKYLEKDYGVEWYYTLLLGFEAGIVGCAYTGDIFNLFVMFEVLSISAYALVAFRKDVPEAVEGSLKYAIVGSVATTIYFIAITFIYGSFGTLNMADLAAKVRGLTFPVTGTALGNVHVATGIALALIVWAFSIEAALVPNHFWLPDAYVGAPVTFSAISSGAAVNISLYIIARYLYTILQGRDGPAAPTVEAVLIALVVMGCLSAIVGSVLMIVQKDINRLIAYSTIVNSGYIAIGLGIGTPLGIVAALFHMINHAVAKALLFFCAGNYVHVVGSRDLDDLAGVGKKMPLTTIGLVVGALALAGVPPLNCFMSKLILAQALFEANLTPLIAVIVFASVLSLMAYLKIIYNVYCRAPVKKLPEAREHPLMAYPVIAYAITCIVFGLLAPILVPTAIEPAVTDLLNTDNYIKAAMEIAEKLLR